MSQFQFPCPKCQQPVLCDEQYRGMDLSCPHCNAVITAPPPAGAPLGKPGPKVSTSTLTQSHEAPKPTVPLPPPYVPRIKKGSPKWVTPVVVVVVIAVIAGFLYENPSYVESAKTKLGFAPTMKPATTNAAPADVAADIEAGPGPNNNRDILDIRKVCRICKTGPQDQADDHRRNLLHWNNPRLPLTRAAS